MSGLTPKLPLILEKEDGYLLIKSYRELIKQNFKNIILTSPGERVMDPNFGVGLRRFLFENDTQAVRSEITSRILSQTKSYMPFVEVINISFREATEVNKLNLIIQYDILPLSTSDVLEIPALID
jgi:uncharacterized protein